MDDDKKMESLGRTTVSVTYWLWALKIIAVTTVIFLVIYWLVGVPLWCAPITGALVWLVYRFIRRLILRFIIWLGRL